MLISSPYLYTHFAQFDWLKEKFYTSIKSRAEIFRIDFPSIDIFGNIWNILKFKYEL